MVNTKHPWSIRSLLRLFLAILTVPVSSLTAAPAQPLEPCDIFDAGAARGDITGPFADVGMMGYAEPSQVAQGLHMRLWSRALVVKERCGTGKTVAIVTNDLAMIFYGLKRAVLHSLEQELPGVFHDENLLLSATHTHSGPGGYAHHALYNFTTLGFHPDVFEAFRRGTVAAIVQAYRNRVPATLAISQGELEGFQFNRSKEAYERNPLSEKALYGRDHDPTMVLLKVTGQDGTPLAAWNWYGIHPVSIPINNRLISGDNKGLAAYLMEKKLNSTTPPSHSSFVAAFSQGSAGDISPYPLTEAERQVDDGFYRNAITAQAQSDKALSLWANSGTALTGPLATAHQFASLAQRTVIPTATFPKTPQKTCFGSLGVSFAAGTENGQPLKIFREGTVYGVHWPRFTLVPKEQACQSEKVVLLPTGMMKPWPWTASVAPFQIIRIGALAIVATPFEITTMAGRRLAREVEKTLAVEGVKFVVINSMANEYLHYVTTREEFAAQAYEGGSNLFGPWSLEAYSAIYKNLANAMLGAPAPRSEALPLDLTRYQIVLKKTPKFDTPPAQALFGDVVAAPQARYQRGDMAEALFYCAHPNHHAASQETYLTVERETDSGWTIIRDDDDQDTFFVWEKSSNKDEPHKCRVRWQMSPDTAPGAYRLCHLGTYRVQTSENTRYHGCTDKFILQ